jgi:hypothetical protein
MAYENINFRKANLTFDEGYFYNMDEDWDALVARTDDGSVAFTYPLQTLLSNGVSSLEYDGINFWTLENITAYEGWSEWDGEAIKRWKIENETLVLQDQFDLYDGWLGGNVHFSDDFEDATYSGIWTISGPGSLVEQNGVLEVSDYGSGSGYYGPTARTTLSGALGDFAIGTWWNLRAATVAPMGRTLLRLLDGSLSQVMAIGLEDAWVAYLRLYGSVADESSTLFGSIIAGYTSLAQHNHVFVMREGTNLIVEFNGYQVYNGTINTIPVQHMELVFERHSAPGSTVFTEHSVEDITVTSGAAGHYFDSDAFAVEHYHTSLVATASGGDDIIRVGRYYGSTIVGGTELTIGPNSSDQYEDVTVTSISGSYLTLSSNLQYTHELATGVNFYNNLWVFNSYGTGELFKIDAKTGEYITHINDVEYDDITAATFARCVVGTNGTHEAIIYPKSTNLKFLDPDALSLHGVMTMDNLDDDDVTVLPIYDLAFSGNNIYRLQLAGTYWGTTYSWSLYQYVISTSRSFLDTISVSATPVIIPANGYNYITVNAIVNDQFGDGAIYKPVYFTDDDPDGFLTINPAYTDIFFGTGAAETYYRAGLTIRTVNIVGTATQTD